MTTMQQPGVGGSGDGEPPRRPTEPGKDKVVLKEEVARVVAKELKERRVQSTRQGKFLVKSGRAPRSVFGAALQGAGMKAEKPTAERVRQREEEGRRANEEIAAAKKSMEDEFWGAYAALGSFGYSKRSWRKHLAGGTDPDRTTIDFFTGMKPDEWLATQDPGSFVLVRTTSETYGDGIGFTVYFCQDLNDKRRSVGGFLQKGELTITHVGPIQ